ncbi:MAG: FG-GAP repeat protein, partial [Acidimicrobiales bacterium]|nr:FG-GAP repeat protein [Acidimicrobiales bacterium]
GSSGFTPSMSAGDGWGSAITGLGDIDNDGTPDMAIGSPNSPIGGSGSGAVHIVRLNSTGTVKAT